MLLVAVVVLLLWLCGSLLAVSLCWAARSGDVREVGHAEQLVAERTSAQASRDLAVVV